MKNYGTDISFLNPNAIRTRYGNVIKTGTVFAGARSPDTHNEIIRVYTDKGRRMVEADQYGATLANKDHHKKVIFYVREIRQSLNRGTAHIILVRS